MFLRKNFLKARTLQTKEEFDSFVFQSLDFQQAIIFPISYYKDVIPYLLFCNFVSLDEVNDSLESAFAKTNEYFTTLMEQQKTQVQVCPVTFKHGDIVWNCETCQRDATCVQCASCFRLANHEGHKVYFTAVGSSGGGCCGRKKNEKDLKKKKKKLIN